MTIPPRPPLQDLGAVVWAVIPGRRHSLRLLALGCVGLPLCGMVVVALMLAVVTACVPVAVGAEEPGGDVRRLIGSWGVVSLRFGSGRVAS